jgi:hypothetical protein
MTNAQPVYEIRLRKDKRGVDLISDALPFGRRGGVAPSTAARLGCSSISLCANNLTKP